ncbi:MAG: ATP-grasp domain-containing protein [bacterium]
MARLHEYKGKELLRNVGIATPRGLVASNPQDVFDAATKIAAPVVVKAQAWTTGRAGMGGIQFAQTPEEAKAASHKIFGLRAKNFVVEQVLVEEQIKISREFYAGLIIDDANRCPVIIFSSTGGTGIEEIAAAYPDKVARMAIDVVEGFKDFHARNLLRQTGISGRLQLKLADVLVKLWAVARTHEARSAEINPLILTEDQHVVAVDCRIAVDDYAVFRHPELDIEIARELDRPPSELDKIAYNVEKNDYRGTFYFIQMEQHFNKGDGYVGFHGAGGGGSMMSMDAVTRRGFKIANFTDTSGNPPASKVYRAAKIILAQKNIDAYFGSGSGVASQEQFHSARGLVKAFLEENLSVPAVIRLGGNSEDKAVEILENYTRDLPAPVEGYKKDDSAEHCARRLRELVDAFKPEVGGRKTPEKPAVQRPYSFETLTGKITYDHAVCVDCESKICVESCIPEILKLEKNVPVLAISADEAKRGKCIECLACEIECIFHGNKGAFIDLPIDGLDEYLREHA